MQKTIYSFFIAAFSTLLLLTVHSQNYQPFRQGKMYFYQYNVSDLHFLRIDSAGTEGGDSVFFFNTLAKPFSPSNRHMGWSLDHDNIVLRKMIARPGGRFVFLDSLGDSLVLETQVPVGTNWTFHTGSGTSATLTSKLFSPLLGTSDTILTYQVGTASTITLSKAHGLTAFPDLRDLTSSSGWNTSFSVWRLPGKPVQKLEIFDFEPGDYFGWYSYYGPWQVYLHEHWRRLTIQTRTVSATGDSITYTGWEETLSADHNYFPSEWDYEPWSNYEFTYINHPNSKFGLPVGEHIGGMLLMKAEEEFSTGRLVLEFSQFDLDTFTNSLIPIIDNSNLTIYKSGLGNTYDGISGIWENLTEMECYRKTTDSLMPCEPFDSIVSVDPLISQQVNITAFPNPARDYLEIHYDGPNPHRLDLQLVDLMGKIVKREQLPASGAKVDIGTLPEGMYLLSFPRLSVAPKKILITR